jgi:DNA-binding transcriptional regulator/RsmH inhibitor MraZ
MADRDDGIEFIGVYERALDVQRRIIFPKGFVKAAIRVGPAFGDIYLQPSKYRGYILGTATTPAYLSPKYEETAFDELGVAQHNLSAEGLLAMTVRCNIGWGGRLTIPARIWESLSRPEQVRIIGVRSAFYICQSSI